MVTMKSQRSLRQNEKGLAAVVITVFVMVMLSLVVLAFSQISRREQRQSLDRQLSTQAFYSAESGLNKRLSDIRSGANTDIQDADCDGSLNNIDVDGTTGAVCVLHDKAPYELQYRITKSDNKFISLGTQNTDLDTLRVKWKGTQAGSSSYVNCASTGSELFQLPTNEEYGTKCPAGIVRLQFVYLNKDNLSQDTLANSTYTVFLRPTKNAGSVPSTAFSMDPANSGAIIGAKCDATDECNVDITNVPRGSVFVQLRSIYQDNDITITGKNVVSSSDVRFNDAQIVLDATGRSQDVSQRLQVRVPLYETTLTPGQAVTSASGICKQLDVYPDHTQSSGDCLAGNYFN